MRTIVQIVFVMTCAAAILSQAGAQAPSAKPDDNPGKGKAKDYSQSSIVTRMMAFDKNKDGKLTKDEVTDVRLHRLFDRADANKDGVVTKEELMALAAQLEAEYPQSGRGGFGGPGGPGGPGRRGRGRFGGPGGPVSGPDRPGRPGPGGPGPGADAPGRPGPGGPGGFGRPGDRGRGRFGGPPRPGQVLPPFLQERLNLTAPQQKQLAELQKEVDRKLGKILTDEQKQQLNEMRRGFGPGGPPPGERGRGRRGGPPDGGQADRPAP